MPSLRRLCGRKHPHGRGEDVYGWPLKSDRMETPPRAWGRHRPAGVVRIFHGNTPTGVGKTLLLLFPVPGLRKHPHGRGEDRTAFFERLAEAETPPRAWGRRAGINRHDAHGGNTPTGVGKTGCWHCPDGKYTKHPHGRGEDFCPGTAAARSVETPPRAWGRPGPAFLHQRHVRNTPTGVGKTFQKVGIRGNRQKHPHGRGEDPVAAAATADGKETPPRAWGRLINEDISLGRGGNTPTGVGKTSPARALTASIWKHPHGRGEDAARCPSRRQAAETPPRAWGRREARQPP